MFEFPEYGTEDDKNRWAADTIAHWEGAHFCPHCKNRMNYEASANRYWCYYCDGQWDDDDTYEDEIDPVQYDQDQREDDFLSGMLP